MQERGMEDYEDGLEEAAAPPLAPGRDALESVVRPALVAATRLFLVAGVVLVLVDETGELRGAVAAGDLAPALEDAAPQLWSGPSLEVLAGGAPVQTPTCTGTVAGPPWPTRPAWPASTASPVSRSRARPAPPGP